jgi:hypothetical protein
MHLPTCWHRLCLLKHPCWPNGVVTRPVDAGTYFRFKNKLLSLDITLIELCVTYSPCHYSTFAIRE